ncbi:MAG: DUF6882 domain-containing protein [Polyangiales bacterium]
MLANKFRRLALLMEPDIQRMLEKQAQRSLGHDDVRFDERQGFASFLRHGGMLWQPRAEKIGVWHGEVGLFRWWWTGTGLSEHARTRLDMSYREGQRYQLPELTSDPVQLEGEEEAEMLARLAAQLSRADGCLRLAQGEDVTYVALFEAKPGESTRPVADLRDTTVTGSQRPAWLTVDPLDQPTDRPAQFVPAAIGSARPPAQPEQRRGWSIAPPVARHDPGPMRSSLGIRSIPPVRALEVSPDDESPVIPPPPRVPTPPPPAITAAIREPNRAIFMPVASAALADLVSVAPGFGQALVVVRVEVESASSKGRFFVQLVCSDESGELVSLDPSRALLDAAAKFIGDDVRDGNGRWKKLVARLRPTPRGASVDVEVS